MKLLSAFFKIVLLVGIAIAVLKVEANEKNREDLQVRVRLEADQSRLQFEAQSASIQGHSEIQLIAIPRRTFFEVLFKDGVWHFKRSSSYKPEVVQAKYLVIQGKQIQIDGKLQPETLILSQKSGDRFDVIGVLPLEQYLVGVVSAEMPKSWPLEALKAQAVAARSYVMSVMRERSQREFHVEDTIMDQVFRTMSQAEWQGTSMQNVLKAVQETQGQYLMVSKSSDRPLKSFYHAHCGGQTTNSQSVWGSHGVSQVVVDAFCENSQRAKWIAKINLADLETSLSQKFPYYLGQKILKIETSSQSDSERSQKVFVVWQFGPKLEISGDQFRQMIGYGKIQSTRFAVSVQDGAVLFQGSGQGHGVGLCQHGTRALAKQNKNYLEILKHYFPSNELRLNKTQVAKLNL